MHFRNDQGPIKDPLGVPRTIDEMNWAIEAGYIIPAFRDGIISVDKMLDHADVVLEHYIPSADAIDFMNFIRLALGEEPENSNPKAHYFLIDCIFQNDEVKPYFIVRNINYDLNKNRPVILCTREFGKSFLLGSMLPLYMAHRGKMPNFGSLNYVLYVSDAMRNNVKTTMETIGSVYRESLYLNSEFESARLVQDEVNFTRNPQTKKEIAIYNEYVNNQGKKAEEVPGRMKRSFSMSGLGASALPLDTILYGKNNFITMDSCRIGDEIYREDGELTTIIEKSEIFNEPIYKIILTDGRELRVSINHINNIYVKKTFQKNKIKQNVYEELNIETSELIHMSIYKKKSDGKKRNILYIKDNEPLKYNEKKYDIDPYTLGILLGDGHLSMDGSVRLEGLSEDIDHYIKQIEWSELIVRNVNRKDRKTLKRISFHNMTNAINNLGLRGIIGSDKFIPKEYMFGSVEQRLKLLQGLTDTDGQVKKYGTCRFDNVSLKLVKGLIYLVRSLGGTAFNITKQDRRIKKWQDLYSVMYYVPKYVPVTLSRKVSRYKIPSSYLPFKAIKSIELDKCVQSQCIAVNSPSKLFLAGNQYHDIMITHNTGGRGSRVGVFRPQMAIFDDLLGNEADANSEIILGNIESTIESDILPALHGSNSLALVIGTPYNKNDPVYKRIEDGSWLPIVFPKAEKISIDLKEDDFRGVWPDRHTYAACMRDFKRAKRAEDNGNPVPMRKLNQEYYLRIADDRDRLVPDSLLKWFSRQDIIDNAWEYNWYITTDYTTTGSKGSDYSGAALWAVNSNQDHFLIDLVLRKLEVETQYSETFSMAEQTDGYTRGVEVGVEIDGQQDLHVLALQDRMPKRNTFFMFARQKGAKVGAKIGIRSKLEGGNKHWRFRMMLPYFQNGKIWFAKELKGSMDMNELMEEIRYCTYSNIGSAHDDGLDILSQLGAMNIVYPSKGTKAPVKKVGMKKSILNEKIWAKKKDADEDETAYDSYA